MKASVSSRDGLCFLFAKVADPITTTVLSHEDCFAGSAGAYSLRGVDPITEGRLHAGAYPSGTLRPQMGMFPQGVRFPWFMLSN
jgi:hypothetical protein